MRKSLSMLAAALVVCLIGGYAAGLFTPEAARRESCTLCRATRFSGTRYGFHYEKIEDSPLTGWFRKTLDKDHGFDDAHAHRWQSSGCPVYAAPGVGGLESTCPSIAPIFLLKPETELAALEAAGDNKTRRSIIDALNASDRHVALERVKLLVEYVYVHHDTISWTSWWDRHASEFGVRASGQPIARR